MKIVHTEASCGWGGQEIRVLEESKGLMERGHDLTVLCPAESRLYAEAPRWGVRTEALPIGRKSLAGLLALRRWLKSHPVDVINTHSSTDSWLAGLACATLENAPPIVRTRHISAPIPDNAPTRWLYTRAARHIVTTGEALRRELIERNGYPASMITSVPTGIDPARFAPGNKQETRRALGLEPDCHYIGIVATLRSWKGHLYLLDAFAALNAPGWKLLIVGDGPVRDVIERRIAELGLAGRVILAGQQKNPEDWLRALDIFCLPSYANEGVPQALVQAMLSGLPIVTTSVGSILDAVSDGKSALIVEPGNAGAIAAALQKMMAAPDSAHTLGESARLRALSDFIDSTMLDRMEHIFRASMTRTPSRILVINVTRIGDTLLATPAIRALADKWPDAEMTVLAHPKRCELLEHIPFMDHVGAIEKNRARWRGWLAGKHYDLAVVFGFDLALVRYALRVSRAVAAFRQANESVNRQLSTLVEPKPPGSDHAAKIQLTLVEALGVQTKNLNLAYAVTTAEDSWAKERVARQVPAGAGPLVGLQIASFPTKSYRDWPLENFIDICERIRARWPDAHFLIFGGSAEASRTRLLNQALPDCSTLHAGRLSLRETGALMKQLDLFVGVDTGPTHIMGTMGIPMVVLYHPYHPSWKLAPPARPGFFAVDHPLAGDAASPDLPMDGITTQSVWECVVSALDATRLCDHPDTVTQSKWESRTNELQ